MLFVTFIIYCRLRVETVQATSMSTYKPRFDCTVLVPLMRGNLSSIDNFDLGFRGGGWVVWLTQGPCL